MKFSRSIAIVGVTVTCIGVVSACSDAGEPPGEVAAGTPMDSHSSADCHFPVHDVSTHRIQFLAEDTVAFRETSPENSPVRCIPGKGAYGVGQQDTMTMFGVSDPKNVAVESWQVAKDDDGWYGVIFAKVRTPSSGLNPGSNTMKLATVDLSTAKADKVVDVGPTIDDFAIGRNRIIVAIDSEEEAPSVVAFDMTTGKESWRRDRALSANGYFLAGNSITLVGNVAELKTKYGVAYNCKEVSNVDVATGKARWSYNSMDPAFASPGGQYGCATVGVSLQSPSFTVVSVEKEPLATSTSIKSVRTQFIRSNESGGLVDAAIDTSGAKQVPFEFRDPVSSLSVFDLTDRKHDSDVPMIVIDRASNKVVFEVSAAQAGALNAQVRSIFDGKIYMQNSDGKFVVDARTGDDTGEKWTNYPIGKINGYTVYSEGTAKK